MFSTSFLHSICFPWMVVSHEGEIIDQNDGAFFSTSQLAKSEASYQHYKKTSLGWSCCPNGFATYCCQIPQTLDQKLILYGMKVFGVSTAQGKTDPPSIKTTKSDIEHYIHNIFLGFENIDNFLKNIMGRNVHEVRGINKDIKVAVETILFCLAQKDVDLTEIQEKSNNIKALSEILSSRTDFLDYFANPALAKTYSAISVHKKFYKTIQSLTARAEKKEVGIQTSGNSIGSINALHVFEVIPFIIIENAIKYSPVHAQVDVCFIETNEEIKTTVRNLGPPLENGEEAKIFNMGYRGKAAASFGIGGYGMGLSFVKELVERHHKGTIQFIQKNENKTIGGRPYCTTEIILTFRRVK